jgi:hypothetical protein
LKGLKRDRGLEEITAKRLFTGKKDLEELYQKVCEYYGIRALQKGKGEERLTRGRAREVFAVKIPTVKVSILIA